MPLELELSAETLQNSGMAKGSVLMRARMVVFGAAFGMSILAGCTKTPIVPMNDLFEDVRRDEIEALDKYGGRWIQVSGTIVNRGLKTRVGATAERHDGVVSARRSSRQVPFLTLGGGFGEEGNVVCFFENTREVKSLREGGQVVVEGKLTRVKSHGTMPLAYLQDCSVVEYASDGEGWEM